MSDSQFSSQGSIKLKPSGLKILQQLKNENKKLDVPATPETQRLGYGTGVGVYTLNRANLDGSISQENLSPWALKKIERHFKKNKEYSDRLKVEGEVLKSLNHPNIIGFRGEGKTKDGRLCLAMEKCGESLGDLIQTRHENSLGPFPLDNILKVAECISSALQYLHEEKCILHGDIKSFNVLIKDNFSQVKLCDFGTPIRLDKQGKSVIEEAEYVGTDLWSAPEVLYDNTVTNKADIFAFGCMLWEMLALRAPHMPPLDLSNTIDSTMDSEDSIVECTASGTPIHKNTLEESLCLGTTPELPDGLPVEYDFIIKLIAMCTVGDYKHRPSATELIDIIQKYKSNSP